MRRLMLNILPRPPRGGFLLSRINLQFCKICDISNSLSVRNGKYRWRGGGRVARNNAPAQDRIPQPPHPDESAAGRASGLCSALPGSTRRHSAVGVGHRRGNPPRPRRSRRLRPHARSSPRPTHTGGRTRPGKSPSARYPRQVRVGREMYRSRPSRGASDARRGRAASRALPASGRTPRRGRSRSRCNAEGQKNVHALSLVII